MNLTNTMNFRITVAMLLLICVDIVHYTIYTIQNVSKVSNSCYILVTKQQNLANQVVPIQETLFFEQLYIFSNIRRTIRSESEENL